MMNERPTVSEYAPFYAGYVGRVPEHDSLPVLERQVAEGRALFSGISEAGGAFRYAPEQWSVRQVLGHLIDAERVFGFRAFCFARGDPAPRPGFDEQAYVAAAPFERCSIGELLHEFELVRRGHVELLSRLDPPAWRRVGTANGTDVSVRALAFIMAGHVRHHLSVLQSQYGLQGGA